MRNDTLQYYDRSAAKEAARYESLAATRLDDVLARWVPRGSCVLELGCGSGRDARKMAARGAFVMATDGSPAMIAEAERLRKEAVAKAEASGRSESTTAGLRALRFQPLTLPPTVSSGDTASSSGDSSSDRKLRTTEEALAHLGASSPFDAVVAIGVLQHLGDAALYDTALFLDAVLTDTGVLVLAVPENHAGPTAVDPRYYSNQPAAAYSALLSRFGFEEVFVERTTNTGAPGLLCTWVTMVLVRAAGRLKAERRLLGVLEDDRKTATYKLALLRAVADINIAAPHRVRFQRLDDPTAAVRNLEPELAAIPFSIVIERWLEYYWRLTYGADAPRQIVRGRVLGFEASLETLRALYKNDWWHFRSDYYGGVLDRDPFSFERTVPPDLALKQAAFRAVVQDLADTIKKGPVTYSGNAAGLGTKLFATTRVASGKWALTPAGLAEHFGDLLFPAPLWKELLHSAPWFVNTVILEWARLSSQFSARVGTGNTGLHATADILARLLPDDAPTRDTLLAAEVYRNAKDLRCVWSGRPIQAKTLAVDHMIPWARTHCNDLWNLLPADRTVNGRKSDKLPSVLLLDRRRDELIRAWRLLEARHSALFRAQIENSIVRRGLPAVHWETPLFDAVLRTTDDTARQFGAPRWDGEPAEKPCAAVCAMA